MRALWPSSLAIVALALVPSCGGGRRVVVEQPPPVPSSGGVVIVDAPVSGTVVVQTQTQTQQQPQPQSSECGAMLVVYDVQVRSGCRIDERVTRAPGRLSYPCGGGPAQAWFADSQFVGTVDAAGNVMVEIQTGFPFSDGCQWTTKQQIMGNLGAGALRYEYREEPDRGQRGCAAACVATATVRMQ